MYKHAATEDSFAKLATKTFLLNLIAVAASFIGLALVGAISLGIDKVKIRREAKKLSK